MTAEIVRTEGVSKAFGKNVVLRDIDLSIARGEVVAIIGPSGSGKSTLLRCLNLLETPSSGVIRFEGQDIAHGAVNINRVRMQIGMVFQHFNLFPHLSVLRNITLAPSKVLKLSRDENVARARELLAKVGLPEKEDAYPNSLSGGQKQRVAIARALALRPRLMLFDEPTSALDPEMVHEVLETMKTLADEGTTMVVVTHEMGFARRCANRIVFMDEGRILLEASPGAFFANSDNPRVQRFLERILN